MIYNVGDTSEQAALTLHIHSDTTSDLPTVQSQTHVRARAEPALPIRCPPAPKLGTCTRVSKRTRRTRSGRSPGWTENVEASVERRKWCVSSMLANVRADARRDTRRGRFGGARAVRRRERTLGRAWGRRAAHWHVVGDALCLPRAHKQRRTVVREAEAGGSGGKAGQ